MARGPAVPPCFPRGRHGLLVHMQACEPGLAGRGHGSGRSSAGLQCAGSWSAAVLPGAHVGTAFNCDGSRRAGTIHSSPGKRSQNNPTRPANNYSASRRSSQTRHPAIGITMPCLRADQACQHSSRCARGPRRGARKHRRPSLSGRCSWELCWAVAALVDAIAAFTRAKQSL